MGDILQFPIKHEVRVRAEDFIAKALRSPDSGPASFSGDFHILEGDEIAFSIRYHGCKVARRRVAAILLRIAVMFAQPPKGAK